MPNQHVVKQGEHLASIAEAYGFADARQIWDDPRNAELKKKRRSPDILMPWDVLVIPDRDTGNVDGATEQTHRFKMHRSGLKLRLVLLDVSGRPEANLPCRLLLGTRQRELQTDDQGRLEVDIAPQTDFARLVIQRDGETVVIPIHVGRLDPITEPSGVVARLNNLGYDAGDTDPPQENAERQAERLRSAIEEFQCDHGLAVDGVCGRDTRAKLEEIHGC